METEKRFKRGDVREDGKVFGGYVRQCAGGEYWTDEETFRRIKEKSRTALALKRESLRARPRVLKKGDVCSVTGRVFWAYGAGNLNGENWLTPEKYEVRNDRGKKRRARVNAATPEDVRRNTQRDKSRDFRKKNPGYGSRATQKYLRKYPEQKIVGRLRARLRKHVTRGCMGKRGGSDFACARYLLWAAEKMGVDPHDGRGWHVEHLRPASYFDLETEEGQHQYNSPENTWWMTGAENLSKHDRLPTEQELADHASLLAEYHASTNHL